ncbi:MAG: hypothetical protein AB1772_02900 [Candidatus Zixiibacteriota bacterium]
MCHTRTLVVVGAMVAWSLATVGSLTAAGVPALISYQGLVTDASGNPIDGTVDVTIRIWDDPTSISLTNLLYTEPHPPITIESGLLSLVIGSEVPLPDGLFDGPNRWLGITIDTDPELDPRIALASVPYSMVTPRVLGDFTSAPGSILLSGESIVTPWVEERLRLTDLSVSIIADRGAGDKDSAEMAADRFCIYYASGAEAMCTGQGHLICQSVDLISALPPLPPAGEPYVLIADDVFNQLFYTMAEAGKLRTVCEPCGTLGELLPDEMRFISGTDTARIRVEAGVLSLSPDVSVDGLDVGGFVQFTDPRLVSISSGTLTFTGAGAQTLTLDETGISSDFGSVTIDNGTETVRLATPLTVGRGLSVTSGATDLVELGASSSTRGTLYLRDGTIAETARVRSDGVQITGAGNSLGSLTADDLELIKSGGNQRLICTADDVSLVDLSSSTTVTLSRTSGLVLVPDVSGTSAVYTAEGIQLTGPTAREFAANPTAISLTRPSSNRAVALDLDNPSGHLALCDIDDDGALDFAVTSSGGARVWVTGSAGFVCDNGASFGSSCSVAGATTCSSTLSVSGTLTCTGSVVCRNSATWDINDDATTDLSLTMAPSPELLVATGTRLACDGLSTFAQPVQVNSDLTVTGALTVLGPKAFVQAHPGDDSKEIIYVALEGNEAGTYTRGSAVLRDGVAEIDLPEDFALVTNGDGLTAQVTPRGPVRAMLYVDKLTASKLVVKASDPRDKDVKFDFMVNGVRRGYENHQAIRERTTLAATD